jgi:hypothetical protein
MTGSKDEIYIDCQPVNSDGQTLVKLNSDGKDTTVGTFNDYVKNPILGIVIGSIYFLLFFFVIKKMFASKALPGILLTFVFLGFALFFLNFFGIFNLKQLTG